IRLFLVRGRVKVLGTYIKIPYFLAGGKWVFAKGPSYQMFIGELVNNTMMCPKPILSPTGSLKEKNWIPVESATDSCKIVVNINTRSVLLYNSASDEITSTIPDGKDRFAWRGGWSGSSAFVPFRGKYLGILHRKNTRYPEVYEHMFVVCDENLCVSL